MGTIKVGAYRYFLGCLLAAFVLGHPLAPGDGIQLQALQEEADARPPLADEAKIDVVGHARAGSRGQARGPGAWRHVRLPALASARGDGHRLLRPDRCACVHHFQLGTPVPRRC